MTIVVFGVYALVVAALLGLVTAAVWVPRPWQLLLLYGGPVTTLLVVAGVPGFDLLGWVGVYGIPYALMTVLPLVPWRREWARWALSSTVLGVVVCLVAASGFDAVAAFYLGLPALAALAGLGLATLTRRDRLRPVGSPLVPTPQVGDHLVQPGRPELRRVPSPRLEQDAPRRPGEVGRRQPDGSSGGQGDDDVPGGPVVDATDVLPPGG
ncbi:hypothetical protein [Phycicoccus sonneratiae]|uniref:Uncharacterized protein n=1 Tax=Phycicoccus sonneratiae TaxID=2807628 RepID=A0ABS2CIQ2_9MICO|nr:hypothetical protein [Phycicoccus sonneraticus]MBM6399655.1 hypothetical protein [Phycicoccus sonneraticus]